MNKTKIDMRDIICFEDGLPGLWGLKRFVIMEPEKELPFKYLQSVDDESIALVVSDPYLYMKDYAFEVSEETLSELGAGGPQDIVVLVVIVVPSDISRMTANFAAPILINVNNRKAKQIILEGSKYRMRQPIYETFKELVGRISREAV